MAMTLLSGTSTQPSIVRELIRLINAGGMKAGDRLPSIRALAEQFGVTGSAIRDAQIQLQTMGVIKIMPRSGAVVQSVSFAALSDAFARNLDGALMEADPNLLHLLDARQVIEVECATLATRRCRTEDLIPVRAALSETLATAKTLDEDASTEQRVAHYDADMGFHLAIAELAGNPVLTTMLRAILDLLKPRLVPVPCNGKRRQLIIDAHLELFEALRSGDAEKMRRCMGDHNDMARDSLLRRMWGEPEHPGP